MAVATMSELVKTTFDEDDDDDDDEETMKDFPLPNVSSPILEKVIEYCTHYQGDNMTPIQTPLKSNKLEDMVQPWYADYVKVPKDTLFDLVAAANYMDIKPLLDLTCLAVSILIKGKSAEELREMFNISEDFTPEETAAMEEQQRTPSAADTSGGGADNPPAVGE